jgi:D-beta-D-heptose 7-phosphate kinase/D-beta-D-heptose 1-phosphate adenosyltransferase
VKLTRLPSRIQNYYIARERDEQELPWVRPGDFAPTSSSYPASKLARPVVVVNGAFDLLHAGHMKVIFAARKRAGTVIVAMDSDERVARKGTGRPILRFPERARALEFMPVDYIVEIENDKDMARLLTATKCDLRVQGFEYRGHPTKFPDIPKCFVRVGAMSTSKIVDRIRKNVN